MTTTTPATRLLALALALLPALLVVRSAEAEEITLSVDVPSDLGGATYLANQTVLRSSGSYGLDFDGPAAGLGPDANVNAVTRLEDGAFLFSTDAPFTAGGSTYEARDVVRYDGDTSLWLDGGALGLGPSANVDALGRDGMGRLVLSLDVPETVLGSTFQPSDLLVLEDVSLELWLAGSSLGVPAGVNVVGFDRDDSGDVFVAFDVPVVLGGQTFLPGDVARWDGGSFALFFRDAAFPRGAASTGFSLPGSPGRVAGLMVQKSAGTLDLSWGAACSQEASDYGVVSGALGAWYAHEPAVCGTGGLTAVNLVPGAGGEYYLVTPMNGHFEGSYGTDSSGAERPAAGLACLLRQKVLGCP